MTIIFEQREVNDQVLLIQLQFQSHNVKVNGSQVVGLSLDKYFGVDVWSQMYTKLEAQIELYKADTKAQLKEITIPMNRAQLELRISWKSKKPFHKEVAYQQLSKERGCDLCPYVLVVKVAMVSALDKYKKQHTQQELKTERPSSKPSTKSIKPEPSEATDSRTSNGSSSNDVEEYVPAPITSIDRIPKYTPSALSMVGKTILSSMEKISVTDEYTPALQRADDKDDIITYTPTKIDEVKLKSTMKTDLNRNDYPEKKKRTDTKICDLFGDSGDEPELENNGTSRFLRSTKKPSQSDVVKGTPKPQSKLDGWVTNRSKKGPDQNDQNRPLNEEVKKKRKLNADSPAELSSGPVPVSVPVPVTNAKEAEAQKLRKLAQELQQWDQMNKPASVDRFIDLKDMTLDQINGTFHVHKDFLRDIFRRNAKIPDRKIDPTVVECDYLLFLNELVTEAQQGAMYTRLRAEFCKSEKQAAVTSDHENLFWKILLPEWALNIFMDENVMERKEAIEQLRKQDQAKNMADTDDFDFI